MSPGACRSCSGEAKTGQRAARLVGCEVGPVEPGYQGQDLLGRPASAVDHYKVLLNRFWQCALKGCFHALGIQIIPMARDRHCRHWYLRSVFSVASSLICLYCRRLVRLWQPTSEKQLTTAQKQSPLLTALECRPLGRPGLPDPSNVGEHAFPPANSLSRQRHGRSPAGHRPRVSRPRGRLRSRPPRMEAARYSGQIQ